MKKEHRLALDEMCRQIIEGFMTGQWPHLNEHAIACQTAEAYLRKHGLWKGKKNRNFAKPTEAQIKAMHEGRDNWIISNRRNKNANNSMRQQSVRGRIPPLE